MHVTTVAAGGVDLIVRRWGDESGDSLLFWPALNPWGSLQLIEAAPVLADCGFHVLSVAAPGAGESPSLADADQYRPTSLAQLVVEIADALSLEQFTFIGASWGASVGVCMAAMHPERVRALVLLDGGYADSPVDQTLAELEEQIAADQERFAYETWDAYLDWARQHASRWSDGLEARYREGMTVDSGRIVARADPRAAAWALWGLAQEPVSRAQAALGDAGVPTLLIVPADLGAAEFAAFRTRVPHAVIKRLDAGHDILQEQPREVVEEVAAWRSRS